MESKASKKKQSFLPVYFKKIGLLAILLAVVPAIIIKLVHIEMIQPEKDILLVITLDIFIIGLIFISFSRDKVEDEMTEFIRLKSMAFAFMTAAFYVIIIPIINFLLQEPIDIRGQQLVITMLLMYLVMFYIQKRGR